MKRALCLFIIIAGCLDHLADTSQAQFARRGWVHQNNQPVYYSHPPTYSKKIYTPTPHYTPPTKPADPREICGCGNTPSTGDCQCKNLKCELKKLHCNKIVDRDVTHLDPPEIYGKIPRRNVDKNCLELVCEFYAKTKVPEIHCVTEECNEIGKRKYECFEGCYFQLCIPVKECTTVSVECKLVEQNMLMRLMRRFDKGRIVYDVYVINNSDPNSGFQAGGMPAEWLIMHCASAADIKRRFPDTTCKNGEPLVQVGKGDKLTEDAEVDIALIFDKEKIEEYMHQVANQEQDRNAPVEPPKNQKNEG